MQHLNIENFSRHLFWDTKRSILDVEKDKSYIIHQVLEYGKFSDWKLIKNYYGISQIATTAKHFRTLESKALSFVSALSGISREKFRCYSTKQSNPPHWNF